MDQSQTIAILLIAMLIIGGFFAPSIISEIFSGIRGFFKDFRSWMKNFGNEGNKGFASFGLEILYKDGTTKKFEPKTFSLLPIKIIEKSSGLEIVHVTLYTYVTLEHNATTIDNWNITVINFDAFVSEPNTSVGPFFRNKTITATQAQDWPTGTSKSLDLHTFTAGDIEQKIKQYNKGYGTYKLNAYADVIVTLESQGETFSSEAQEIWINWNFEYKASSTSTTYAITSISAEMRAAPLVK